MLVRREGLPSQLIFLWGFGLQILWLALNLKPFLCKGLDQGVKVCYLVVVGYLHPVDQPVGIHVLHAFNSIQGIPCPVFGNRSFATRYIKLDDLDRTERCLACKQNERAGHHKKNCEPPTLHDSPFFVMAVKSSS